MIGVLIFLIVLGCVAWLGFYVIGKMSIPAPGDMVARVIFGLILLLVLLQEFGLHAGGFYVRY